MAESHREDIAKLESIYAANPAGRVFTHLADAYRRGGEPARAREILDEGLRVHPDSASAYVVLGRLLEDAGQPEEAEAAFARVLALDPENRVALRALGDMARAAGREREAMERYRRLQAVDPSDEEVAALLATEVSRPEPAPERREEEVPAPAVAALEPSEEPAVEEAAPAVDWGVKEPPAEEAAQDSATPPVQAIESAAPEAVVDDWAEETAPAVAADVTEHAVEPAVEEAAPAIEWGEKEPPVEEPAQDSATPALQAIESIASEPVVDDAVGENVPPATPTLEVAAPHFEGAHAEWDGLSVLITETMGDLYRAQGHLEHAAEIYQTLLSERGSDEKLEGKLRDVEQGLATAAAAAAAAQAAEAEARSAERLAAESVAEEPGADDRVAGMEAVWSESGEVAEGEPTPYAWEAAGEDEVGRPVAQYLQGLVGWRRTRPDEPSSASTAELEPAAPAHEEPELDSAPEQAMVAPAVNAEGEPAPPGMVSYGLLQSGDEALAHAPESAEERAEAELPPEASPAPAVAYDPLAEPIADLQPAAEAYLADEAGLEPEPQEAVAELAVAPEAPSEADTAHALALADEAVSPEHVVADAALPAAEEPGAEPAVAPAIAAAPEVSPAAAVASMPSPEPIADLQPTPEASLADEAAATASPSVEEPVAVAPIETPDTPAEPYAPPQQSAPAEPPRAEPSGGGAQGGRGSVIVNPWSTPPASGPIWVEDAGEGADAPAQPDVVWVLDHNEASGDATSSSQPEKGPKGKRDSAEKRREGEKRDDDDLGMFRAWLQSLRK